MDDSILNLIDMFEESYEKTNNLKDAILKLSGVLKKLDESLVKTEQLIKISQIDKDAEILLEELKKLRKTSKEINIEYKNFMDLEVYNQDMKKELNNIRSKTDFIKDISIKLQEENINKKQQDEKEFKKLANSQNKILTVVGNINNNLSDNIIDVLSKDKKLILEKLDYIQNILDKSETYTIIKKMEPSLDKEKKNIGIIKDSIFFINRVDNYNLYSCNKNFTNIEKITNKQYIDNIEIYDDNLYFKDKNTGYVYKLIDNKPVVIISEKCIQYELYNDCIYYNTEFNLKYKNLNNNLIKELYSRKIDTFEIVKDSLFIYVDNILYMIDLETEELKKVI